MGIKTVVSVVPHDKNVTFRYFNRLHVICSWFGSEVFTPNATINNKLAINHLNEVTCHCDHPLDKNFSRTVTLLLQNCRSLENDYVIDAGLPEEIRNLLGDDAVTNVKGWIHGKRRDEARLCNEPPE